MFIQCSSTFHWFLSDWAVKPLAKKLYEKIFLKITKVLFSNDGEITVYKGGKKPHMIGNMDGKFEMEIMWKVSDLEFFES